MATKKTKKTVTKQVALTEINCPQHLLETIKVLTDEGNPLRQFAICTCNVRSNMWKGRVVWEHVATKGDKNSMADPEPVEPKNYEENE